MSDRSAAIADNVSPDSEFISVNGMPILYITSYRDLLKRHTSLSHPSYPDTSTAKAGADYEGFELDPTSPDFAWSLDFSAQHILPAEVFDFDFLSNDDVEGVLPPRISSFPRFSSRLPDLGDDEAGNDVTDDQTGDITHPAHPIPWSITNSQYERLYLRLQSHNKVLPPGSSLPSRNVLNRNLESFFRCSQEQLPFIHQTSFSIEQKGLGLTLAVATLGSLFRFEHAQAFELYDMARAILRERTNREHLELSAELLSESSDPSQNDSDELERIQTYTLLTNFASWMGPKFLPEALVMGKQLSILVKQSGISESDEIPQDGNWATWVAIEERRRTLFAAYALLNLHQVAHNTPASIINHEIGLCVPGTAASWKATTEIQWREALRPVECSFQDLLYSLFEGIRLPQDGSVSAFANYLLIHGILQQMHHEYERSAGLLEADRIASFETALRTWQSSWELTSESTLDPLSVKGPLALNGTALFRIAYMRLLPDFSPNRKVFSGGSYSEVAANRCLKRSRYLSRAVLHAAHALSIPVRLGVELIARTYIPFWSIEHSLSSFECAILLSVWLRTLAETVSTSGMDELNKGERWLLSILTDIIKETSFAHVLDSIEDNASCIEQMAKIVAQLWARIFSGGHVYEIDNVIKTSFHWMADINPD
jgi:hypothetical protein